MRWAQVAPASQEPDAEAASAVLTASEFARYRSLRPDAARAFLAGRRLLRDLVATLAGVEPSDVTIEARCPYCGGAHGRPAVLAPPAATTLHVGLAHSASIVVAVAAWGHAVGLDVERADAAPAPQRARAIETVAGASGVDALAHWTRVEAVLKADGRGLRVDPRMVRITGDGDAIEARIDGDDARYRLASLDLGADSAYVASVAVRL